MAYTPENNPYIPGDPYSYDLKWLVAGVKRSEDIYYYAQKAVTAAEAQAEAAFESAEAAEASAAAAAASAEQAATVVNGSGFKNLFFIPNQRTLRVMSASYNDPDLEIPGLVEIYVDGEPTISGNPQQETAGDYTYRPLRWDLVMVASDLTVQSDTAYLFFPMTRQNFGTFDGKQIFAFRVWDLATGAWVQDGTTVFPTGFYFSEMVQATGRTVYNAQLD